MADAGKSEKRAGTVGRLHGNGGAAGKAGNAGMFAGAASHVGADSEWHAHGSCAV